MFNYLYSFENQMAANSVTFEYFSCPTGKTASVFDEIPQYQQVPPIVLDFQYIELKSWTSCFHKMQENHSEMTSFFDAEVSTSLEAICSCESQDERKSKSIDLVDKFKRVKQQQELRISKEQQPKPIRSRCEDFLNSYLVDRIKEAAEGSGFTVLTNKSVTGVANKFFPSRLETSRPDLLMYSETSFTGIVVNGTVPVENVDEDEDQKDEGEEKKRYIKKNRVGETTEEKTSKRRKGEEEIGEEIGLFASVSENKLTNTDPRAQLLGNMEKLAGVLAYHHLKSLGCKGFRYITIYGLIITYELDESTSYKLTMDFLTNTSQLLVEHGKLSVEHNINRLMCQMNYLNATKEIEATKE